MKTRRQPRTRLVIKMFPSVPKGIWLGKSVTGWLERNVFYREFQVAVRHALAIVLLIGGLAGWGVASLILNYQSLSMAQAYKVESDALDQQLRVAKRDYVTLHARLDPIEKTIDRMQDVSDDIAAVLGIDFGPLSDSPTPAEIEAARETSQELQARFDHLGTFLSNQREQLAHTPSISPVKERFWLTSRFGPRTNPFTSHGGPQGGRRHFHSALDLACAASTPIYATAAGTVEWAGHVPASRDVFRSRYGNYIILNHGNGFKTIYAHCKDLNVEKGQKIERGDLIAWVGSTGRSTGPHLHYEVLLDGRAVNPAFYILDLDRDIRHGGATVKQDFAHESELYEAHLDGESG